MGVSRLRWHRRDGPPKENVGRCGGRSHKEGGESAAAPAGVFQHPEDPERSRKFPEWVCPYVAYSFASFPCISLLPGVSPRAWAPRRLRRIRPPPTRPRARPVSGATGGRTRIPNLKRIPGAGIPGMGMPVRGILVCEFSLHFAAAGNPQSDFRNSHLCL